MKIISYLSLFLLVFDLHFPYLKGVGSAPFSALLSFLCLVFTGSKSRTKDIIRQYRYIIFSFLLMFLYVFIRIALDIFYDVTYLGSLIRVLVILFASILYLCTFNNDNLANKLINIFFINSIVSLFVGTYTEYQEVINIFKDSSSIELIGYTTYRNSFLSGSGYFGIGAAYGLFLSFFISYFYENRKSLGNFILIKLFLIFIAGVFAARTVFFCVALSIFYLLFIKRRLSIIFLCLIVVLVGAFLLDLEMFSPHKAWLLEFFQHGTDTASLRSLLDAESSKFPDNAITILFGDGRYYYDDGSYYMHTDIGYLRNIFFGGIFLIIFIISILLILSLYSNSIMYLVLILPVCLLLHYKGVFMYNNPACVPLLIFIAYILRNSRKENNT